jgi:hypothetical protein
MATTLMPLDPAASPQRVARLLPIAANLLPVEVVAGRRARRLRSQVIAGLMAFAVLLGGWYAFAAFQAADAEAELESAAGEAEVLTRRQSEFADVIATQNESKAISARLSTLLAEDMRWAGLLNNLRSSASESGVTVTGMSGALASATGAGDQDAADPRLPSTASDRVVASLTVTGVGQDKADIAAYVDALLGVKEFANPYLTSATVVDGKVQFSVRVDVTAAALGGRFTKKSTAPGGN